MKYNIFSVFCIFFFVIICVVMTMNMVHADSTTLYSSASLDGYVRSDGNTDASAVSMWVGDFFTGAADIGVRGFVSFDISTLSGTINSATLRVNQHQRSADPYVDLGGEVRVDHMNYGTSLDAGDYNAAALNSNIGIISNNNTLEW